MENKDPDIKVNLHLRNKNDESVEVDLQVPEVAENAIRADNAEALIEKEIRDEEQGDDTEDIILPPTDQEVQSEVNRINFDKNTADRG